MTAIDDRASTGRERSVAVWTGNTFWDADERSFWFVLRRFVMALPLLLPIGLWLYELESWSDDYWFGVIGVALAWLVTCIRWGWWVERLCEFFHQPFAAVFLAASLAIVALASVEWDEPTARLALLFTGVPLVFPAGSLIARWFWAAVAWASAVCCVVMTPVYFVGILCMPTAICCWQMRRFQISRRQRSTMRISAVLAFYGVVGISYILVKELGWRLYGAY